MGVLFEKPQEGYKANLISTIVDGWMARLREEGYKANLISTIVDEYTLEDDPFRL